MKNVSLVLAKCFCDGVTYLKCFTTFTIRVFSLSLTLHILSRVSLCRRNCSFFLNKLDLMTNLLYLVWRDLTTKRRGFSYARHAFVGFRCWAAWLKLADAVLYGLKSDDESRWPLSIYWHRSWATESNGARNARSDFFGCLVPSTCWEKLNKAICRRTWLLNNRVRVNGLLLRVRKSRKHYCDAWQSDWPWSWFWVCTSFFQRRNRSKTEKRADHQLEQKSRSHDNG